MVFSDRTLKVGYIVSYPPAVSADSHVTQGMAWYMKKLLPEMPQEGFKYQVFANRIDGEPTYTRIAHHIEIIRCWDRRPTFIYQLLRTIKEYDPDIIHFQYEFFEFGTGFTAFLTPLLLLALKFWGIPVLTGTASLPSLKTIDRNFLNAYGLHFVPVFIIRMVFQFLIRSASALSQVVVVAQTGGETFAQTLVDEYNVRKDKIVVTPMPAEEHIDNLERSEARTILNLPENSKVLLFFGFLSRYKGLEMLIDAFAILAHRYPEMRLIIAGGDTPGLKTLNRASYFTVLKERAVATGSPVRFTGYVPEQDITLYFSAADLLILPYVAGLSSSGPLVIAMAYNCPFIASTALSRVVSLESALFESDMDALVSKVEEFFRDANLRMQILENISQFKAVHSWARLAKETSALYLDLLETL